MKKLLLLLCVSIGLQAFASPFYTFSMNSPYVYCEGSVEMWLQDHWGGSNVQGSYSTYEIYDDSNNLIERIVVDPSINSSSIVFSQNLPVGNYCAYGGNLSSPTGSINHTTPICFEVIQEPVLSLVTFGLEENCVGITTCFDIQGANNLSYTIINYDYGTSNVSVPFNGSPMCPIFSTTGTFTVTFTVETACGLQEVSETVTIENCQDCSIDAGFTYTRVNCNEFTFIENSQDLNMQQECSFWVIDGQIDSPIPNMILSQGTHQICRSVMGYVLNEPTNTCCDQYCVEIVIPETILEEVNIELCNTPNANILYSPVIDRNFSYYEITAPGPIDLYEVVYSTNPNSPFFQQEHSLSQGHYLVYFYNDNGCLIHTQSVTINLIEPVEPLITEVINLTFCTANGKNGAWSTVCDYFQPLPFNFVYEIIDPDPTDYLNYSYNSDEAAITYGNNGCITHFFVEGSYHVYLYDKDNCTKKSYLINSTPEPHTTSVCHKTLVTCDMAIDPNGVLPDNCSDCYDASRAQDFEVLPAVHLGLDPITGLQTFEKKIIDWENCNECTFTFDVVSSACDFTPTLDVYPLNGDVLSYQYFFNNTDISEYACGPATWFISGGISSISTTLTGDNVDYLFTDPGYYTAEMTVCYCLCGEECCKTISHVFEVDRHVGFTPPTGKSYEIVSETEKKTSALRENEDFIVVPNPINNLFSIKSKSGNEYTFDKVTLTSINGKVMDIFNNISTNQSIDISSYTSGTYVVDGISLDDKTSLKKEIRVTKTIIKQ